MKKVVIKVDWDKNYEAAPRMMKSRLLSPAKPLMK